MINIPEITDSTLAMRIVDSSALRSPGPGGEAFQRAVSRGNDAAKSADAPTKHAHRLAAIEAFKDALEKGLDPLRVGYTYSRLGELGMETGDLDSAITNFLHVLSLPEVLYEALDESTQYLGVVLDELGRGVEAERLSGLSAKVQARLGRCLSATAKDAAQRLVRAQHA